MPSLRESQGIKKDVSGNRNAKKLPINMICIAPQKRVLFSQKKKRLPFLIAFSITEMEGFELPTRNIVVHCPSLCSLHALLISRSFGLPPPATGSGHPLLPRHRGASGSAFIFYNKKRLSFDSLFSTEMEGFEPSRRVNDLYP